jgi:Flp pilus assembly protein TadG
MKSLGNESGQALVEFAVFISIFVLLLSGIVDYSIYIHQEMELCAAAAAGASFGIIPGNQENTAGMITAATHAAPDVKGLTVTATDVYMCTPGGAQVTSGAACSGSIASTPIMYVQVTATATVPALLKWAGISSSLQLQGKATYRVPWTS